MSREQLLSHLTRLLDQLEKEREERNFFQLERDQLYGFWKVAKDEVEDIRARLRNKEKELDDAEDLRQRDIAVYKQQIKCTLHEHQTILNEMRVCQLFNFYNHLRNAQYVSTLCIFRLSNKMHWNWLI